jgi:D-beta-D-heptose 7-phosphate kinase/D-beta-D-heptose 1-phosphate adenosyltransferase
MEKLCSSLDVLSAKIDAIRQKKPDAVIGFTSGAFDILHPGHMRFLSEARDNCDFLVVAIASDRTVREQKGPERPYIDEARRAETMTGLIGADAIIISDEPYHETILQRIKPQVLFKGAGYTGKKIMGAELVNRVKIIDCGSRGRDGVDSTTYIERLMKSRLGGKEIGTPTPP